MLIEIPCKVTPESPELLPLKSFTFFPTNSHFFQESFPVTRRAGKASQVKAGGASLYKCSLGAENSANFQQDGKDKGEAEFH